MTIEISNPYAVCPVFETERFKIRLVQLEDAENLLQCYSDPKAIPLFNSDNCRSGFEMSTVKEMRDIIQFWLAEYKNRAYIRFSVVNKSAGAAVGTIEFFCRGGLEGEERSTGVFRLDLASVYEKEDNLYELISAAGEHFRRIFEFSGIVTKAVPQARHRIRALQRDGYDRFELNSNSGYSGYYLKIFPAR